VQEQIAYTRVLQTQLKNIRNTYPQLVGAMRAELDVPEDAPTFARIMEESHAAIDSS
jgi:hypothetical protein